MRIRFDRLERVAKYLSRKAESTAFNMCGWSFPQHPTLQGQCGFAGCAMGWVAHRKMFRGFKLVELFPGIISELSYYGANSYHAVAKLFGIDHWDAEDLFGPDPTATPKSVAKAIRKFIRDHKKVTA